MTKQELIKLYKERLENAKLFINLDTSTKLSKIFNQETKNKAEAVYLTLSEVIKDLDNLDIDAKN